MLVLAVDTSTPTLRAAVVAVAAPHEVVAGLAGERPVEPIALLAEQAVTDAFSHAERLMPLVQAALQDAGRALEDLDAVVAGLGPGPFTGLRVGLATAAALGDALDRPVHGVPSHDGVAAAVGRNGGEFLVVTDARRREVYASAYRADGRRSFGPAVLAPTSVPAALAERNLSPGVLYGAGTPLLAEVLDLPAGEPTGSTGEGLVRCATAALLTGVVPGPLVPLYLRRPDATVPTRVKSVLG